MSPGHCCSYIAPLNRSFGSGANRDVNALNRTAITEARKRAKNTTDPNQIVANLSFGFWANMTNRAHERILWVSTLHQVFKSKQKRSDIHTRIAAIAKMRNRIAHHNKLFGISDSSIRPTAINDTIKILFKEIHPEAGAYVHPGGISPFDAYIKQHSCPSSLPL